MKILVLGGTRFVGRNLVEIALAEGHEVTLFHRGKTNPDLFPQIERIIGDRDGGLSVLSGRRWDVAVDTCGYVPRIVKSSAEFLADSVEHYVFISTLNVYADCSKLGIDEDSPLAEADGELGEEVTDKTYGPLKVLCERAAENSIPGRALILRCGLIVGPHDPSDRFTYWVARIGTGGEVLAPSPRKRQVQFIDARDLAQFILLMSEERAPGIFNATGPASPLTTGRFLSTCVRVLGSDARFTWVDEEFVIERKAMLPVWVPKQWTGLFQVDCSRAIAAGLTFRPLHETVAETMAWHRTRPAEYELKAGLSNEQERELLNIWHREKD